MTKTMLLAAASALTLLAIPAAAQNGPPGDCYLCAPDPYATTTITQDGTGNEAEALQTVDQGQTIVEEQHGRNNYIEGWQNTRDSAITARQLAPVSSSVLDVYQGSLNPGDANNSADAVQTAGSNLHLSVSEIGHDLTITARQGGNGVSAYINQIGDGHEVHAEQRGGSHRTDASDYDLRATQRGARQYADIAQINSARSSIKLLQGTSDTGFIHGSDSRATVLQQGADSHITAFQSGFGDELSATQLGQLNTIETTQSSYGAASVADKATVDQAGTSLLARITQKGIGEIADVRQSGSGGKVTVQQTGEFAKASITQGGVNNTVFVNQH